MSTVRHYDIVAVFDQAIESIKIKVFELKRIKRQTKSRLDKANLTGCSIRSTEKYRQQYYAACLELETWQRRLEIAVNRRNKAMSNLNYYKIGGSC